MRKPDEIQAEEQHFFHLVWYERKLVMLQNIQEGIEALPDEDQMDRVTDAMRKVEAKYGNDIGVKSDFEWGMINGKLSALRWVLGDEWDLLDT
ncbi:hypothetical protein Z045_05925 [Rhodococcus pyridinivorans KG-16]|uniref:Uncharacterized protein n=1 Tax=Rhodococcus pyridinivorans KG-16 TaxID=1441730 RepID=A0A0V9UNY1_9NOCA|nr:hypothetical protein [Rhodococcus pyridinivorans]KSZ59703.1 hypothetical protein Z045_05925 [Rhodococcus pyridinivorans KG-16]